MQTQGLACTTTKEIARAAGYSEATLYKLFDDKYDLFLSVLVERLPAISVADGDAASLAGTGSVVGNLQRFAVEMTSFYRAILPIGMSVFSDSDLLERHRNAVRTHGPGPERIVEGITDYLAAEQEAGRVAAAAPVEGAAMALVGACMHEAFLWCFDGGQRHRRPRTLRPSTTSRPRWWPRSCRRSTRRWPPLPRADRGLQPGSDAGLELAAHLRRHQDPPGGGALLACRRHAGHDVVGGPVQVGVLEHQGRVVAAEFQLDPAAAGAGDGQDRPPRGHRPTTPWPTGPGSRWPTCTTLDLVFPHGELAPNVHDHLRQVCAAAGVTPTIAHVALQYPTVLGLVAAGCGLALVLAAIAILSRPRVVYLPLLDEDAINTLVLTSADGQIGPIVDAVAGHAEAVADALAPGEPGLTGRRPGRVTPFQVEWRIPLALRVETPHSTPTGPPLQVEWRIPLAWRVETPHSTGGWAGGWAVGAAGIGWTAMDTDEMLELLRDRGHRATRPRRAVWAALLEADGHVTVEELARDVREREPGVNLASVYRALALFEELDLVRESRLGDEAGHWELAHPDEQFHLVCESCGRVDHHGGPLVGRVRDHLDDDHGFVASTVELIVTGQCRDCATG